MLRFFIGYDDKEPVSYHVLAHSILKRSSIPVSVTPLARTSLGSWYYRPRGEGDSTDFSNSRWIVPALCNYEGWAVYMDCDMMFRRDPADIRHHFDDDYAVQVVKHNHVPRETEKFLGNEQTTYSKKNWSSFMVFNNDKCRMLTPHIVNTMTPALWFHQFNWLEDEMVGTVPFDYNVLVGYNEYHEEARNVHWTSGGPWHGYNDVDYANEWWDEYNSMVQGDNPVNYRELYDEISKHEGYPVQGC